MQIACHFAILILQFAFAVLLADVRQQRHETGALDSQSDGVLARGGATAFATADDLALTIGELVQELKVFVVNEQRTWTFAIDEDWIFLFGAQLRLRALAHRTFELALHSRAAHTWHSSLFRTDRAGGGGNPIR